jgi:hypothetical protein
MLSYASDLPANDKGTKSISRETRVSEFFIKNCPQATGLFAWGEHAY